MRCGRGGGRRICTDGRSVVRGGDAAGNVCGGDRAELKWVRRECPEEGVAHAALAVVAEKTFSTRANRWQVISVAARGAPRRDTCSALVWWCCALLAAAWAEWPSPPHVCRHLPRCARVHGGGAVPARAPRALRVLPLYSSRAPAAQ